MENEQEEIRVRRVRRKNPKILYRGTPAQYDFILLFAVLCLMAFGLIMLYSVTNYEDLVTDSDAFATVKKQFTFMVIGLILMLGIPRFDYHLYLRLSYIIIALVILLCAYTMFFGVELNGQRRWINIGFAFQPSELAKPALILVLARSLTKIYKPKKRGQSDLDPKFFACGILWSGAAAAFVVKTNLSTGIIVFLIGFFMLYIASKARWIYPALIILGIALIVVLWNSGALDFIMNDNRKLRIYAWLNPEDYEKSGYQILQSLYAVSSGGLFGRGLGTSIQKLGFLPEAQNDMIFAIICEELGWVGAIFTMLLFVVLFTRIYRVAQRAKDMSGFLIVSGVMIHLIIQTVFNICVAANVMPNTGVTLPFISSGGTALVSTLCEIGLVMAVNRQSPTESDLEEAENE